MNLISNAKLKAEQLAHIGRERIKELEITRRFEIVRDYFKGQDFETDIDELIASLQIDSVGEPVSFEEYNTRKDRITAKVKYLRNQAGIVIGLCSAAGAKVGAKLGRGNPAVIADVAVAGGSAGVLVVGFFAGRVFLKRYKSSGAINISKLDFEQLPT